MEVFDLEPSLLDSNLHENRDCALLTVILPVSSQCLPHTRH